MCCNIKVGLIIFRFFFYFSSEVAGGTPHTVRCNIEGGQTFFLLSELVGGTPHSVGCNNKHFVAVVVVFFDLKMF